MTTAKPLRVGMVGYAFMGAAHSHAWRTAPRFFDLPLRPELTAIAGRNEEGVRAAATKMGWASVETDWRALIERDDIDLIELNEAFAAQSLAVIRTLGLNEEITNVNGGAIALGHPLGCSGAKLTTSAIYELGRRGGGKALVTMCIGGGMGAAGVLEVYPAEETAQAAD